MSVTTYLAVFVIMAAGATVQSTVGFGQALVAAPLLRMVHPDLLPGPLLMAGMFVSIGVVIRDGRRSDIGQVAPAIAGRVVGIAIAVVIIAQLPERAMTLLIAGLVIVFVAARLFGLQIPKTRRTLVATGFVSGVAGAVAALGGAPMALLYEQHTHSKAFRGPLSWYTVIGSTLTIIGLAIGGQFGATDLALGVSLLPPLALGLFISRWTVPVVDRGLLGPVVMALAAGSALVLLIGAL